MVLIFFLGNYGIHRYYTSQQYKLKISIKNKILADAENIFGELSASSKLSLTDYKILTEIILTEHQIYLLPKIYNFGGKITLNQPVIQLNLNRNDPYKNPYCSRFLEISNISQKLASSFDFSIFKKDLEEKVIEFLEKESLKEELKAILIALFSKKLLYLELLYDEAITLFIYKQKNHRHHLPMIPTVESAFLLNP